MKRKILTVILAVFALFACAFTLFACGDEDDLFYYYEERDSNGELIGYSIDCNNIEVTELSIPESYKNKPIISIGRLAFYGCSSLTSINIPNSVTSIGYGAFEDCSSLTSINIPNSVTSIATQAFWGCSSLTSINIPNSVTSIGVRAFCGCSSLTSIVIPNSVTHLNSAFSGCDRLTIYCEAKSKPSGWVVDWNPDDRPVVWGYVKGSE